MANKSEEIRVMSVSFSGIDGAGKSTQIDALRAFLDQSGLEVRVIAFWDEIATLKRFREGASHRIFKSEPGVGTADAPVNRRDKNIRSGFMTCVRLLLYLFDALSLLHMMRCVHHADADVIIFDRFTYDELANLNLNNPAIRLYTRFIMTLVPRPDLSILLDAEPGQARVRKPEYPVEFLIINRAAYLQLSQLIPGITVVAPMPAEDVAREIKTRIRAPLLASRNLENLEWFDRLDGRSEEALEHKPHPAMP